MAKILKHFYLTETNCKDLERLSAETGKSQAEIVREAIEKYIEQN
ncbi:MAG TPA: ribbon-helix-helix protein, CopG family [Massilibacterium sp.]|nr:ribbon-helix-helix protein, CopG family [Massilibacterium sp.]